MVALLPLCVALLSNNNQKYLSYVKEEGESHKHLRFSGEEVVSRSTKFAIERSSKHKDFVHLRSCYNNKYWTKKSEDDEWIVAAADKPEENADFWSCTLFEPMVENSDGYGRTELRFLHIQSGLYASLWKSEDSFSNCLYLRSDLPDFPGGVDLMTLIDWDTLVILPKRVAFRGSDGKYLTVQKDQHPSARFSNCEDKSDPGVVNEVVTNRDGTIRIKNCERSQWWTSHQDGQMDVEEPLDEDKRSSDVEGISQSFKPVKVASNVIALLCLPLYTFCHRSSSDSEGLLLCKETSIVQEARFEVEGFVASREVYNVVYHLDDSRIYDEFPIVLSSSTVLNSTTNSHTAELVFSFQETSSFKWMNGVSLSSNEKVMLKSVGIPKVTDDGVVVSGEFSGEYEWGETKTETSQAQTTLQVSVPPMTQLTVRQTAVKGTCDVPFSYTLREVYGDGTVKVYQMDDGVFTGTNYYGLKFETEGKPVN